MKIFMLIRYLNYSGAPKMFLWVARSLAERGHEVTICTFDTPLGLQVPDNVKWIDITSEHRGFIGKIRRLRHIIKRGEYKVSISFLLDSNVYNIFACYGLQTKSVICERNDPFKSHYYKLRFWKPWFRLADGAVFQLQKVAEFYSNIRNFVVIPNPIMDKDNIICLPYRERKKKIVTHGRLNNEQKRHDVLINAFAMLHRDFPEYTLSIYGKDDDESKKNGTALKTQIEELGLKDCVILEGETMTPKESIRDAMFWVLTSDFEGIPNALIEAMSIGLPCISTDCRPGGARFLIQDGKNGYLVERGDVKGLYEKMCYMIHNPQKVECLGKEAMRIKDTLAPEVIIGKWEEFLKKL